jgi:lipopolysaccharide export system permease protein
MKFPHIKRLHLLIFKSFIGPLVLIFFVVLFILLMQFLWRYIDELVGKGLEFKVIAELLMYTSASLVPMALPLAVLMASLMTFGNMGEFYELTAIKASGISLQRVIMPLVIMILVLCVGAFFFANDVLPYTNLKMRSLLYDVRKQRPEIIIMPGTFYNGMTGYSIRVERRNPLTNIMYDIKIYDHTEDKGNINVIIADSGSMTMTADKRNFILTLYDGYSYNELQEDKSSRSAKTYPHRFDRFKEQQLVIELVGFDLERTDENLFKGHYQMMNVSQLEYMSDSVQKDIVKKYNQLGTNIVKGNYYPRRDLSAKRPIKISNIDTSRLQKQPDINRPIPIVDHAVIDKQVPVKSSVQNTVVIPRSYYAYCDIITPKELSLVQSTALSYVRNSRSVVVSSIEAVDYKVKLLRRFQIEWHRKFTLAFACFVFLLIGAPLGAIIRKGGLGLPLVISTLLFIFYYMISLTGEKMVREDVTTALEGMWMPSAIFFIVGVFLTYKATRDASIFNLDTYTNYFKKFLGTKKTSLLDFIKDEDYLPDHRIIKEGNLYNTLGSFLDSINDQETNVNNMLKFGGFFISLTGLSESTDIILFERLYKSIVVSLKNSDLFEIRPIQTRVIEFPNFDYRNYIDLDTKLWLRFILLFLPPITLLVLLRHYIRLISLKTRLKIIYDNTIDIMVIVKQMSMNE